MKGMLVSSYFQGRQRQKAALRCQGIVLPKAMKHQKGTSSSEARQQILNIVFFYI